MKTVAECCQYVEAHMTIKYATQNKAYRAGRSIEPKGCVNHSIGTAQPSAEVMFSLMNRPSAEWGVNAILGDFDRGDGVILLVMPLERRPWGCGSGAKGSWNNSRVQWEVCEPAGHTYAGGTMINYNVEKNARYFERMWKMLVAWNVYVAVKCGYGADAIADHSEAHKAGYGSNHSDMSHWLPKHGKSMDALRKEVRQILNGEGEEEVTLDEFKRLYKEMMGEAKGDNPSPWAKESCEKAKAAGVFGGDGKGNYNWQDPITREALASILDRSKLT